LAEPTRRDVSLTLRLALSGHNPATIECVLRETDSGIVALRFDCHSVNWLSVHALD